MITKWEILQVLNSVVIRCMRRKLHLLYLDLTWHLGVSDMQAKR